MMAKSKTPALPWSAHTLVINESEKGRGRFSCSVCGGKWVKQPTGECPGLPVYGWEGAPEGLKTKTQLAEKRLKPGQVRGLIPYDKSADGYVRLYLESEAVPMKARTDAQKAATAKAKATRDKNLTCAKCGSIQSSKKYMRGDLCLMCHDEVTLMDRREREQAEAIERAGEWVGREFVVFDFETTGLVQSRPVSLCIIDHTGVVLLETLINPGIPIPPDATYIHGITNEMVATAPTFAEVYERVFGLLDGKAWVAYNIAFDRDVLVDACDAINQPRPKSVDSCDVMYLAAPIWGEWSDYWGDWKWVKLVEACWCAGIDVAAEAHSSAGDCLRTLGVLKAISARAESEAVTA